VVPNRWIKSSFELYDYSGNFPIEFDPGVAYPGRKDRTFDVNPFYTYVGGGGYFLSSKAVDIILEQPKTQLSEDLWIGQVLGPYIRDGKITAKRLEYFEDYAFFHFNCTLNLRLANGLKHAPRLWPVPLMLEKHKEFENKNTAQTCKKCGGSGYWRKDRYGVEEKCYICGGLGETV
jgi:hypothetical protein